MSYPAMPAGKDSIIEPFSFRQRVILIVLATISICGVGIISRRLDWPSALGFSASIIRSPHRSAALAVIGIAVGACVCLGCLMLGRLRYEAGLFAAACGLAALASRTGAIGAALRAADDPKLYASLCLDTLLLTGMLCAGWLLLRIISTSGLAVRLTYRRGNLLELFIATLVQALITALFLLLFARTDVMKQVMAATFIAALLGALAAHQTIPVDAAAPFWVGTLLVGVAAFAWASLRPGLWRIGLPASPLAAVPPLAYASMGTAGAILGYWASQRWKALESSDDPVKDLLDEPPEAVA